MGVLESAVFVLAERPCGIHQSTLPIDAVAVAQPSCDFWFLDRI
jgi:hypothetical protein